MNWLKNFLNAIVENGQMARDARTNNLQAQQIRDKYKASASEKDPEKKAALQNEAQESAKQALISEASILPMYIAPINPLTEGLIGTAYGTQGGIDLVKNKPWQKVDSEGNKRSTTERVLNTGLDALMLLGGVYGENNYMISKIHILY